MNNEFRGFLEIGEDNYLNLRTGMIEPIKTEESMAIGYIVSQEEYREELKANVKAELKSLSYKEYYFDGLVDRENNKKIYDHMQEVLSRNEDLDNAGLSYNQIFRKLEQEEIENLFTYKEDYNKLVEIRNNFIIDRASNGLDIQMNYGSEYFNQESFEECIVKYNKSMTQDEVKKVLDLHKFVVALERGDANVITEQNLKERTEQMRAINYEGIKLPTEAVCNFMKQKNQAEAQTRKAVTI